jgi:hypothetical protein
MSIILLESTSAYYIFYITVCTAKSCNGNDTNDNNGIGIIEVNNVVVVFRSTIALTIIISTVITVYV